MDAKLPVCSLLPPGYFPLEADLRLNRDIELQSNTSHTTMETAVNVEQRLVNDVLVDRRERL